MKPLTPFALEPAPGSPSFDPAATGRMAAFWPGQDTDVDFIGKVPVGYHGGRLRLVLPWTAFGGRTGEVAWKAGLHHGTGREMTLRGPEKPAVIVGFELIRSVFVLRPDPPLSEGDVFTLRIRRAGTDLADSLAAPACALLEALRLEELR